MKGKLAYLLSISLLMLSGLLAAVNAQTTVANTGGGMISCHTGFSTIHTVIFLLGVVLLIVGAVLYFAKPILPAKIKKNARKYALAIIVCGMVAVLLAISAGFILTIITNNSLAVSTCTPYSAF